MTFRLIDTFTVALRQQPITLISMIYNGEIPTVAAAIYTVPSPTPGVPSSGSNATIDFFRIVNESGVERTFTIWLVVDGNPRAITPVGTILPVGADRKSVV